ncbi:MAG: hypothetical protein ACYC4L_19120 [Chloroflexota bacterium]
MAEPIVYVDSSEIRAGKLGELKAALNELVALVEANEPRLLAYNVYFSEDDTRLTVIHVHHDSASLEYHMKVAGPAFPKFAAFVRLLRIDLYGAPSEALVEQMRQKARMLGTGTVMVHARHAGFARFAPSAEPTGGKVLGPAH